MLLGEPAMQCLGDSHVVVVGLGAVGGYALEGLARAGVGNLRLVDFDVVSPTNINRQLLALDSTIGQPKVELAAARVKDINPDCNVEPMRTFLHTDTLDEILAGRIDMVIDAIDALLPKVELIAACVERKIPIISSMGAALR
ncbi:MAG: ThiF family adenylyltransferase, partial [Candidatus Izemoplasmatales bacterium]|nr:ThiF family adenylyltransferase [Candidatus Izemoplasmatales bacterium]